MAIPIAVAGADQVLTFAHLGDVINLDGGASFDPDGTPIDAWLWTLLERPPGSAAVLAGAATQTPSFTADATGTFRVFLQVQSGGQWSEASILAAPDSAFQHTVIKTQYRDLWLPASGQRAWAAITNIWGEILDALAGRVDAHKTRHVTGGVDALRASNTTATNSTTTVRYVEHFQDLHASGTAVHQRAGGSLAGSVLEAAFNGIQIDHPRNVVVYPSGHVSGGNVVIHGTTGDGMTAQTETIALGGPDVAVVGQVAWSQITEIEFPKVDPGPAYIEVRFGQRLGFGNAVSATNAVFKVTKNGAHVDLTGVVVDVAKKTVDLGVLIDLDDVTLHYYAVHGHTQVAHGHNVAAA